MKDKLLHVNVFPFEEHSSADLGQIMTQSRVVMAMGHSSKIQMQVRY